MIKKTLALFSLSLLLFPNLVFAHSTVSPSQVTTSKYETFTVSVPTEKDIPTIGIRLLIPDSLDRVTPFVKAGWNVNVKKEGEKVLEIEWTGNQIPKDQKDVFQFTARTPKEEGDLIWKVYQTYQDGEIVAWDQNPKAENNTEVKTPYSITQVTASSQVSDHVSHETEERQTQKNDYLPTAAIVISLISLLLSIRKSR